jgi:NADH-quinone oxidoreductase subunit J
MLFIHFIGSLSLLITSSFVAFSANPVNSIIFLISTFVSTALVLFLFGVDFLSLIFIIVYVGAIAVLFLFVIMMVAIKTKEENLFGITSLTTMLERAYAYFFLFGFLMFIFESIYSREDYFLVSESVNFIILDNLDNIFVFGQVLYNNFAFPFLLAGLILLLALLGAVVLTHSFSSSTSQLTYRSQLIAAQSNTLHYF